MGGELGAVARRARSEPTAPRLPTRARTSRWTARLAIAALLLVALGSLPAPSPGAPSAAGVPDLEPPSLSGSPASARVAVAPEPARLVQVNVAVEHRAIDLGLPLALNGSYVSTRDDLNYSWSGLPKGCPSPHANNSTDLEIRCVPAQAGKFLVTLSLVNDDPDQGSANVTVIVAAPLSANVSVSPPSGAAPLAVVFFANVTGGAPPVSVSWISSDGWIGSGVWFNHTFLSQGRFRVDLWVNDSTSLFNANGSFARVYTVNVSAPPPVKGLFGLPGHDGVYLILAIVVALVGVALYQTLSRRKPQKLPPAEAWMRPPEGKAATGPSPPRRPPGSAPGRPPPST